MQEMKHHLVAHLKICLVFFLLVASVVIFVSYGALSNGLIQNGKGQPPNWNFLKHFSNFSFPDILSWNKNDESRKILCLIMTREKDLETKARAVNQTWARRCHKHLFLLSTKQKRPDFLSMDIPDNRFTIVQKIRSAFQIIYKQYINEFDWLIKTDDDTYVVMENLQYLLSKHNSSQPGHLGYRFRKFLTSGYMSGGAGYVVSKAGFQLMMEQGIFKNNCAVVHDPDDPETSEDVETGRCLEKVGVPVISSLDELGRETFHPYPPNKHLVGPLPDYIVQYGWNPVITGEGCCSKYSTTFHYLSPLSIYMMEHIIYKKGRRLMPKSSQGLELSLEELKPVSY